MARASRSPRNGFVQFMRKIYNPIGFSKGYNLILWFLSLGYLFGFTLARLYYLSYDGIFCNPNGTPGVGAAPGECYYYLRNPFEIGMKLHLYCILPAALLVILQFTPAIRYKAILFHRLNGYVIVVLSLISNAGVLIVARHSFGGEFATQAYVGMLVILTTLGYIMAWLNIKLLQIDQHRAWMMRTWSWFATIITLRIIMIISASIISQQGYWYVVRPCSQIAYVIGRGTLEYYPGCAAYFDGTDLNARVIVHANLAGQNPLETAAALGFPFGTAGWIATVLHTIAIEVYLRLTPAESDRLRQVSYERQLQRGCKRPGYNGLTAERFGDANPYIPIDAQRESRVKDLSDQECGSDSQPITLPVEPDISVAK